jgi:hypothetical protein
MAKILRIVPGRREDAIDRLQRKITAIVAAQHPRGFEISRNEHRVPTDINGRVYRWRGLTFEPRRKQLPFCARNQKSRATFVHPKPLGKFRKSARDP